jgi:malonyl-CoA O-methyltransferase
MTGDNVASAYDRWSTVYDHDGNPLVALEEPVVRAMLDDLPAINGLSALDLGCGTGRHALHLAERGARVTALDFSEGMLEQARAKPGAERITFIHHDAAANPLPFEPASFDLLVSALVLEHVPDLAHFFAQSKRVLKPGAPAIFTAMHPAMMLRGAHARFTDPDSGDKIAAGVSAVDIPSRAPKTAKHQRTRRTTPRSQTNHKPNPKPQRPSAALSGESSSSFLPRPSSQQ